MRVKSETTRAGFTLLEVILATSISLVILYGVYSAIDIHLRSADAGRELTQRSTIARALFTRITNDVQPSLGLPDPGLYRSTDSGSESSDEGGEAALDEFADEILNTRVLAVQGDPYSLRLFVSRVPREAYVEKNTLEEQTEDGEAIQDGSQINSDQREIVYWFVEGQEEGKKGLARQEVRRVTADFESVPLAQGTAEEVNHILAEEVRSVTFAYWDGTNWQDEWDGNALGADGLTPMGPPLAIEVVIELEFPGPTPESPMRTQSYRHVIHIPTANGTLPEIESEDGTMSSVPVP